MKPVTRRVRAAANDDDDDDGSDEFAGDEESGERARLARRVVNARPEEDAVGAQGVKGSFARRTLRRSVI